MPDAVIRGAATMAPTLYDVLGVDPGADAETLKRAFRATVRKHHPDLRGGDAAASHWTRLVIAAHEVLRHPERRAAYDEHLARLRAPLLLRARRQRMMVFAASISMCFSLALVSTWKFAGTRSPVLLQHLAAATHVLPDAPGADPEPGRWPQRGLAQDAPPAAKGPSGATRPTASLASAGEAIAERWPTSDMPMLLGASSTFIPASIGSVRRPLAAASKGDDLDRIIAEVDRLLQRAPDDARAYRLRGRAWARKGDMDRALADLEQAVRIDPNDPGNLREAGLIWQRKGEFDKAIVSFDRAVRLSFSDPEAYSDRGAAWFEKGSYDRALADFERAISINPNLVAAHIGRAAVLQRKGDAVRARADREQAVRLAQGAAAQADATPFTDRDR